MKPMFNVLGLAIVCGLSLATTRALAASVTFEFTGTITDTRIHQQYLPDTVDTSMQGRPVQGRITIETDGLVRNVFERPGITQVYYAQAIDDLVPHFTGSLSIDGSPLDPMSRASPGGIIVAMDFHPGIGAMDQWRLSANSVDRVLLPEYTVPVYRWTENAVALDSFSPELGDNWFSLTGEESVEDLVNRVLGSTTSGSYSVGTRDCVHLDDPPVCQPPFSSVTHRFVVDWIARTVDPGSPDELR